MVRQFLGNVKGLQGDKGDKGEPGGFNNEKIGVQNLLDITRFRTYNGIGRTSASVKDGIINYTNVPYYIETTVNLRKGKHVFRVKDHTSHSHAYGGNIRVQVMDGSTVEHMQDVVKGELFSFDVAKNGEYNVQIRISNVTQVNGFIEKPMLVEGDVPALWNAYNPVKDYHMSTIINQPVTGTLSNPNVVAISQTVSDTTLNHFDSVISLTPGLWEITVNSRFSPVTFEGATFLIVYLNEDAIFRINLAPTMPKEKAFSYVFKVTENSTLTLRVGKTTTESLSFEGTSSNKLSLVKLSEI